LDSNVSKLYKEIVKHNGKGVQIQGFSVFLKKY
jgi:hypothetical protein